MSQINNQFTEFKQTVEAREKEREELENLSFTLALTQGAPANYAGFATNDSNRELRIVSIQVLRGDTNYESALTEAVKSKPNDDWTIGPGSKKSICWAPQHDAIAMLRSLVRSPEPNFPNGSVISIAIVAGLQVGTKQLKKKCVQQVLFQGNQIIPWGP